MLPRHPRTVLALGTVGFLASAAPAASADTAKPAPAAAPAGAPAAPLAPAKEPEPGAAPAAGGAVVEMSEDNTPPSDVNGTDENPDAPRSAVDDQPSPTTVEATARRGGYPTEEIYRPLTLPQNMSEVALSPHFSVNPLRSNAELRARYGITRRWQLGLTYNIGGVYNLGDVYADSRLFGKTRTLFHAGKAVGLDLTVLAQNFLAVKVGVPVYLDPVAVGVTLATPLKFTFFDKFSLGALDDLLEIRISKFTPSFTSQDANDLNSAFIKNNTVTSKGALRFSGYGAYQRDARTALVGRIGIVDELRDGVAAKVYVNGGVQFTPRRFVDVGVTGGFGDLAVAARSFGLSLYAAVRI